MQTVGSIREAADWFRKRFRPDVAGDSAGLYLLELSGPNGGPLSLRIEAGCLEAREEPVEVADVRMRLAAEDLFDILAGRANPDLLQLEDRLHIEGDLSLALKLRTFFRSPA